MAESSVSVVAGKAPSLPSAVVKAAVSRAIDPGQALAEWPALAARVALADAPALAARRALEVLAALSPDREMQWATALAALGEAAPPLDSAPATGRLPAMLEGIRAAEQVWALHARPEGRANAEGLRRLLLAIVRDLRVVPVLLALQLARLRAAAALPDAERLALARLAADLLAPLANRLGIWQLKWEIEDLAFRHLQPETYQRIARLLDEKRVAREQYIEEVKRQLREALAAAGIEAEVAGRPKHIYSIWKKMQRKDVPFGELYDIRAVRVLVADVADCYAALGVVHQVWTPIAREFDDYIARPKGNGYRSLHTAVIGPEGRTVEVQIRTRDMHEQAELGVAAHWRYKEGGGADASFERKIAWMRQLLEASEGDEQALQAGLRTDLVEDRVYVLTPQGKVIDLPRGATVLDFAYAVHTEVGHRCRGAKVNGRIVTLDHAPATGDVVEILTGKEAAPRRDWLLPANGYLVTGRARDKVRAWFHKLDRAQNLAEGRELLDKELRRLGLIGADLAPVLPKLRVATVDDLMVALSLGDIGPAQVSRALHEAQQPKEPNPLPPVPAAAARDRVGARHDSFVVEGVGNLLTQLARCCQPVPGDAIAGYLTRGRGISVHRADCAALARLLARDPDRAMPVAWGRAGGTYAVDVAIQGFDRKSLLKDITTLIAQEGVHIHAIASRADDGRGLVDLRLTLKVSDFGQLSRLLARLAGVPGVRDARRVG
ncbi:RelA/SpoT family protein [Silanimonas lenta]|uniref:RelA/SpoT family protein n=1 Tax=Silanimonas lenta TaxID=265429 RepID=UPI0006871699|nr:bifunctional (p)ppGpp synthetase/guanosine-3',5'-bis(diphosphate) 3'-pyrophosphohydrolase [Silanimonas lenta]